MKKVFDMDTDNTVKRAAREKLSRLICENRPNSAYTTEDWVGMAMKIAPEYDYSKVEYKDRNTDVCITCHKHGDFYVNPKYFLWKNSECPYCLKDKWKKIRCDRFIEKAKKVHEGKYDYSKVEYKTSNDKVCIICHEHGEFWQTMNNHLSGAGCPLCANHAISEKKKKSKSDFLDKVVSANGDKYDYSLIRYRGIYSPVEFICHEKSPNGLEHGSFYITPHSLAFKKYFLECPKCRFESEKFGRRLTKDEFVRRSNIIHCGKYDYSKFVYKNGKTKSIIICPEHGEFLQNGEAHLAGQGCPICRLSHLERDVMSVLKEKEIEFEPQKRFEWLGAQSIDVFIPSVNIAIECQGQQHYKEVYYHSKKWTKAIAERNFAEVKERDTRKRQLCKENGVELIYFTEPKFKKYETSGNHVFTNANELIDYLKTK